ncbi:peroxisome proliferator-activated receptor gamma coactivator 1-beta isoform X2 [Rhinichthys klamathensis goyatoka]|uniref:peroxisome proliferator-activated receptor gamma coactivator 1-beta isoform X2 n=1 Tax=Rhinichthys klamathensis goyatoka TaxID=3034132 RepID=UPI0024B62E0B|nr:peroxisome proliferator-activated receptor gamma coactivator 1-beta isoform X2 [Rhinichthys klamathensis goyatoka]
MADCASLLDEELSSFVFNYLTENSGSQYGEEEVCSDRLDADFPDFDLSQLDASDFDSVNCLSELHWCNEHSDHSPASIQYSAGDPELFEEENAALLAALTDSLDGIVEDGVGGLSVFPSLGDDPEEGEEEEDDLPLDSEHFPGSLSPETEEPSLKGKSSTQERKPRPVRPTGRLCTELHRHLTTAREAEDTEEEEEEDEEDSDSEEEEEESSSSESESMVCIEPPKPQFSSEKELHSVVELIKYMHTYCLPIRKQASWDRKEREALARKTKPESSQVPRGLPQSSQRPAPQTSSGTRPRVPFTRRRETKAHSLLKEMLEAVSSFDVSKPYRMHSPPYIHCRGAATRPGADVSSSPARQPKAEAKDSDCESLHKATKRPKSPEPEEGSFSVRRSRRLASFPSRFAKKVRENCGRLEPIAGQSREEENVVKHPPTEPPSDSSQKTNSHKAFEGHYPSSRDEKRSCLCLPLASKSNGDTQYANKPFEQTLCVELCGTAGLTPPTTPPHKPVEDELFKPDGKAELTTKSSCLARAHIRKLPEQTELYAQLRRMGQTGDTDSKGGMQRGYGDHDYCLLGLGESRKRMAAALGSQCHVEVGEKEEDEMDVKNWEIEGQEERLLTNVPDYQPTTEDESTTALFTPSPEQTSEPSPVRSPTPDLDAQSPVSCSPPSPSCKLPFSDESSETCHEATEKRSKTKCGQENDVNKCQVIYIHNLPSSVTQSMLRKRFEAFGLPEDCKVVIKTDERCGVITLRPTQNGQTSRHRWDSLGPSGGNGSRRFGRKRYIDLDEAGPGPVKSKYDALDFDALLKEAQRSLHR